MISAHARFDALILFSHGSLLCGAGATLEDHAARLRTFGLASHVEIGYLNYNHPSFEDTVALCVARGDRNFLVSPYFLSPGYFVDVALRSALRDVEARWPEARFTQAAPIGYDEQIAEAILASAADAHTVGEERAVMTPGSAACRQNPACPLYTSAACASLRSEGAL